MRKPKRTMGAAPRRQVAPTRLTKKSTKTSSSVVIARTQASMADPRFIDRRPGVRALHAKLRAATPKLRDLLAEVGDHWGCEDSVYRFYHQSWKVYGLQALTLKIVKALRSLVPPGRKLNGWFMAIVERGTSKTFEPKHNQRWIKETAPIVEAFFHARYFLEMAVRYGREFKHPPGLMPSGWAALLYLYDLR